MPIKFTDSHICEKCKKIFEWNYFELKRQNIESSQWFLEDIPSEITLVHSCRQHDGKYSIEVICPYCDYDNHFIFTKTL